MLGIKMAQNLLSLLFTILIYNPANKETYTFACGCGNVTNDPIRFIQEPVGFFSLAC